MPPATLLSFALASDAVAQTTKKLQKQSILAAYLKDLMVADLRLAVRFSAGRPFPATSETVLNVGSATLYNVLLPLLNIPHNKLRQTSIATGDLAEALSTLWNAQDTIAATPRVADLTLQDLSHAFNDLASIHTATRKQELLASLFSRCHHPREAAYLAKILFRDMRTGLQEGLLQSAIAESFNQPLPSIQRAQLLLGDLEEVALLAKHNALSSASFKLFHPLQFMLATPIETSADAAATLADRPFFCEDKLDGIRAQVHKSGSTIHIYTRTMDRTDESFPDVLAQLSQIPGDFLLDGEIVPYANGLVLPFSHIQRRLGRKTHTKKILADNPCHFIAFDLLYLNGSLLLDTPLRQRRVQLDSLSLLSTTIIEVTTDAEIFSAFEAARSRRNEGIVLKDPDSLYSPGRRGKWWLKLKTHLPTFDCVVTAAEFGHGKRRHVLSDYTFAIWSKDPNEEGAELLNLGKSFTGLTDAEIALYTPIFLSLSQSNNGRVHQVTPKIVLEIACDQIQKSDRHPSGYALRFPRIKRIRTDKLPHDADHLSTIARLYQSQSNFAHSTIPVPPPEPTLFDHLNT